MKTCRLCNIEQPQADFLKCKSYSSGYSTVCKACNRIRDKQQYDKHQQKRCTKARGGRFSKKYWPHLTAKEALLEWERLFQSQSGLCSICHKDNGRRLDVEHNHDTLIVRSLACNDCNTSLARAHENIDILMRLCDYIRKHNVV